MWASSKRPKHAGQLEKRGQNEPPQALGACSSLSSFSLEKLMPIVMISESLLPGATASDGRILPGSGAEWLWHTPYWPLMSVDEARSRAMEVLRLGAWQLTSLAIR